MSIIIGLLIIAIGAFCQSSSYVPINRIKEWSWESYWIVQGVFAWLVFPLLGALLAVPSGESLFGLFAQAPSFNLWMTIFFGILWGVGGLTFGLSMRYLGVALGQSIALGTCAALGTIMGPVLLNIFFPELNALQSLTAAVLIGVAVTLLGIAIIGVALTDVPGETDIESLIAPLGSSSGIYVGVSVVAVGSPKGVSGSIGYGIVDAPRTMVSNADTFMYCYQTDIPSSKNSSGVLFNMQGQVVGIITNKETGTTGSNVVMVYGITELKGLIEKMSNGQEISYLGISGTNVTSQANSELGVPMGAFITATDMDSPAMLAGVQVGDVIVAMNDQKISTFIEYVNVLQNTKPGDTVTLTVQRKSQEEYVPIDLEMTVVSRSHE